MKKFIAAIMCAVVLFTTFVLPSFAYTKDDLVAKASESHLYQYVKVSVENAVRTMEITEAQANQLMPILEKCVQITNSYSDTTVVNANGNRYGDADYAAMLSYVDQACAILGLSYTITGVSSPKHVGDIIYKFYDANNTLLVSYDGDMVTGGSGDNGGGNGGNNGGSGNNGGGSNSGNGAIANTSGAAYTSTVVEIVAAAALAIVACATFVVARKKVND